MICLGSSMEKKAFDVLFKELSHDEYVSLIS